MTTGGHAMRFRGALFLPWILALMVIPSPARAKDKKDAPASTSIQSDAQLGYRFQSASGYPGLAGQFESLGDSATAAFALSVVDPSRTQLWDAKVEFLNKRDYKVGVQFHYRDLFTFSAESRSLVKNSAKLNLGPNLSDDINVTDSIPTSTVLSTQRVFNSVKATLRIPSTQATIFVKADDTSKRGTIPQHYFDMGSDPVVACGACHESSYVGAMNYETRHIAAGVQMDFSKYGVITYQHGWTTGQSNIGQPTDFYGLAASQPGDSLGPGVPDVAAGNYQHNIMAGIHDFMDTLQAALHLASDSSLNLSYTQGTNRDTFTGHPMDFMNAHMNFRQGLGREWWLSLDGHSEEMVNKFTPVYALFPNASLRRNWETARIGRRLGTYGDWEIYAKRSAVERSDTSLFPQVYSPDNTDPLKVVPYTQTNTYGTSVAVRGKGWRIKGGYEWAWAHSPGYETDPGLAQRVLLDLTLMPSETFVFTNSASMLWQRRFTNIQRRNDFFSDTATLTFMPVQVWTLTAAAGYSQDDLRTDLIYGNDPAYFYSGTLVPYKAKGLTTSLSSDLKVGRDWTWTLSGTQGSAHGEFGMNPADLPTASWQAGWGSALVDTPTRQVDTQVTRRLGKGFRAALGYQYENIHDWINPSLSGAFRAITAGVSRSW